MEHISITDLAARIGAEREEQKQEAEHGVFDVNRYSHEQQMAMLVMRFNDPLAKAVLTRLHHSTVAGRDFRGLVDHGLALRNSRGYHDFTPRGRYVSRKVTEHLARTFEVSVARTPYASRRKPSLYEPGVKSRAFNPW